MDCTAGLVRAVEEGWHVLRGHLGASLLTRLINVALTLGAEVAVTLAMVVGIGFVLASVAGHGVAVGVYAGLAIVIAIATFWGLEAIVNTFFWSYWSLAYPRLTGGTPAAGT